MPHPTLASLTTLRLGGPTGTTLCLSDPRGWPDLVRTIDHCGQGAPSPSATAPTSSPPTPDTTAPSQPAAEALAGVTTHPASTRITSAELIVLSHDRQIYEWETAARIPLG